jgi:hypothetical protein
MADPTSGKKPPSPSTPVPFSADDFDWREILPYLFVAAALPDEQGIKASESWLS